MAKPSFMRLLKLLLFVMIIHACEAESEASFESSLSSDALPRLYDSCGQNDSVLKRSLLLGLTVRFEAAGNVSAYWTQPLRIRILGPSAYESLCGRAQRFAAAIGIPLVCNVVAASSRPLPPLPVPPVPIVPPPFPLVRTTLPNPASIPKPSPTPTPTTQPGPVSVHIPAITDSPSGTSSRRIQQIPYKSLSYGGGDAVKPPYGAATGGNLLVAEDSTTAAAPPATAAAAAAPAATGADASTEKYDVWVGPASELGEAAEAGSQLDLEPLVGSDSVLGWSGLADNMAQAVTYGGQLLALPLQPTPLLLLYRTDVLSAANLSVPSTWRQLLAAARTLHGATHFTPDGNPGLGVCARWFAGCPGALAPFAHAMLSPLLQSDSLLRGTALNVNASARETDPTAAPQLDALLDDPAAAEALSVLLQLRNLSRDPTVEGGREGGDQGAEGWCEERVTRDFLEGRCALSLSTFADFKAISHGSSQSPVRGHLGAALAPGSTRVLLRIPDLLLPGAESHSDGLVNCSRVLCPLANETVKDEYGVERPVNRAPYMPTTILMVKKRNSSTSSLPDLLSYYLAAYLASPSGRIEDLLDPSTDASPIHLEQMDPKLWTDAGYDTHDTAAVLSTYRTTLEHVNVAHELRMKGQAEYSRIFNTLLTSLVATNGHKLTEQLADAKAAVAAAYNATISPSFVSWYEQSVIQTLATTAPSDRPPSRDVTGSIDGGNAGRNGQLPDWGVSVVSAVGLVLLVAGATVFVRKLRTFSFRHYSVKKAPGPGPDATLLLSDISDSTTLWEILPADVMDHSVRLHSMAVRHLLLKHRGYESATEGDAFIAAFDNPLAALNFATELQVVMLRLEWPEELLARPEAAPAYALPAVSLGSHRRRRRRTEVGRGPVLASAGQQGSPDCGYFSLPTIHALHCTDVREVAVVAAAATTASTEEDSPVEVLGGPGGGGISARARRATIASCQDPRFTFTDAAGSGSVRNSRLYHHHHHRSSVVDTVQLPYGSLQHVSSMPTMALPSDVGDIHSLVLSASGAPAGAGGVGVSSTTATVAAATALPEWPSTSLLLSSGGGWRGCSRSPPPPPSLSTPNYSSSLNGRAAIKGAVPVIEITGASAADVSLHSHSLSHLHPSTTYPYPHPQPYHPPNLPSQPLQPHPHSHIHLAPLPNCQTIPLAQESVSASGSRHTHGTHSRSRLGCMASAATNEGIPGPRRMESVLDVLGRASQSPSVMLGGNSARGSGGGSGGGSRGGGSGSGRGVAEQVVFEGCEVAEARAGLSWPPAPRPGPEGRLLIGGRVGEQGAAPWRPDEHQRHGEEEIAYGGLDGVSGGGAGAGGAPSTEGSFRTEDMVVSPVDHRAVGGGSGDDADAGDGMTLQQARRLFGSRSLLPLPSQQSFGRPSGELQLAIYCSRSQTAMSSDVGPLGRDSGSTQPGERLHPTVRELCAAPLVPRRRYTAMASPADSGGGVGRGRRGGVHGAGDPSSDEQPGPAAAAAGAAAAASVFTPTPSLPSPMGDPRERSVSILEVEGDPECGPGFASIIDEGGGRRVDSSATSGPGDSNRGGQRARGGGGGGLYNTSVNTPAVSGLLATEQLLLALPAAVAAHAVMPGRSRSASLRRVGAYRSSDFLRRLHGKNNLEARPSSMTLSGPGDGRHNGAGRGSPRWADDPPPDAHNVLAGADGADFLSSSRSFLRGSLRRERSTSAPLYDNTSVSYLSYMQRLWHAADGRLAEALLIHRGLRLRLGFHCGLTSPTEVSLNRATGRAAYSGLFAAVAREVANAGPGGCVMMSEAARRRLAAKGAFKPGSPVGVIYMGHYTGSAYFTEVLPSGGTTCSRTDSMSAAVAAAGGVSVGAPGSGSGGGGTGIMDGDSCSTYGSTGASTSTLAIQDLLRGPGPGLALYQVTGGPAELFTARLVLQPLLSRCGACRLQGSLGAPLRGNALVTAEVQVQGISAIMAWNNQLGNEALQLCLSALKRLASLRGGVGGGDAAGCTALYFSTEDGLMDEAGDSGGAAAAGFLSTGRLLVVGEDVATVVTWAADAQALMVRLPWRLELLQHEYCAELSICRTQWDSCGPGSKGGDVSATPRAPAPASLLSGARTRLGLRRPSFRLKSSGSHSQLTAAMTPQVALPSRSMVSYNVLASSLPPASWLPSGGGDRTPVATSGRSTSTCPTPRRSSDAYSSGGGGGEGSGMGVADGGSVTIGVNGITGPAASSPIRIPGDDLVRYMEPSFVRAAGSHVQQVASRLAEGGGSSGIGGGLGRFRSRAGGAGGSGSSVAAATSTANAASVAALWPPEMVQVGSWASSGGGGVGSVETAEEDWVAQASLHAEWPEPRTPEGHEEEALAVAAAKEATDNGTRDERMASISEAAQRSRAPLDIEDVSDPGHTMPYGDAFKPPSASSLSLLSIPRLRATIAPPVGPTAGTQTGPLDTIPMAKPSAILPIIIASKAPAGTSIAANDRIGDDAPSPSLAERKPWPIIGCPGQLSLLCPSSSSPQASSRAVSISVVSGAIAAVAHHVNRHVSESPVDNDIPSAFAVSPHRAGSLPSGSVGVGSWGSGPTVFDGVVSAARVTTSDAVGTTWSRTRATGQLGVWGRHMVASHRAHTATGAAAPAGAGVTADVGGNSTSGTGGGGGDMGTIRQDITALFDPEPSSGRGIGRGSSVAVPGSAAAGWRLSGPSLPGEQVVLFRGLRLRIGMDMGHLQGSLSKSSGRIIYRGRPQQRAARLAGAARAGQVLATRELVEGLIVTAATAAAGTRAGSPAATQMTTAGAASGVGVTATGADQLPPLVPVPALSLLSPGSGGMNSGDRVRSGRGAARGDADQPATPTRRASCSNALLNLTTPAYTRASQPLTQQLVGHTRHLTHSQLPSSPRSPSTPPPPHPPDLRPTHSTRMTSSMVGAAVAPPPTRVPPSPSSPLTPAATTAAQLPPYPGPSFSPLLPTCRSTPSPLSSSPLLQPFLFGRLPQVAVPPDRHATGATQPATTGSPAAGPLLSAGGAVAESSGTQAHELPYFSFVTGGPARVRFHQITTPGKLQGMFLLTHHRGPETLRREDTPRQGQRSRSLQTRHQNQQQQEGARGGAGGGGSDSSGGAGGLDFAGLSTVGPIRPAFPTLYE